MIEPIYSLRVAAELIPMQSVSALYQFLHKNKSQFTARYRVGKPPERVLSENEILKIRSMVISTDSWWARRPRPGRPKGSKNNGSTRTYPTAQPITYREIFSSAHSPGEGTVGVVGSRQ